MKNEDSGGPVKISATYTLLWHWHSLDWILIPTLAQVSVSKVPLTIPIYTEKPNNYPIQRVRLLCSRDPLSSGRFQKWGLLPARDRRGRGHIFPFCLGFRRELNWISYYWSRCKHFTRQHCNYTLASPVAHRGPPLADGIYASRWH